MGAAGSKGQDGAPGAPGKDGKDGAPGKDGVVDYTKVMYCADGQICTLPATSLRIALQDKPIYFRAWNDDKHTIGFNSSIDGVEVRGNTGGMLTAWNGGSATWDGAGMALLGNRMFEFGRGVAGKEANAGKIGYQVFDKQALDIVGAGAPGPPRKVRVWDQLHTGHLESFTVKAYNGINLNGFNMYVKTERGWPPQFCVDGPDPNDNNRYKWFCTALNP